MICQMVWCPFTIWHIIIHIHVGTKSTFPLGLLDRKLLSHDKKLQVILLLDRLLSAYTFRFKWIAEA